MKKLMCAFRDYERNAKIVILRHPVYRVIIIDVCVTVNLWLNEICKEDTTENIYGTEKRVCYRGEYHDIRYLRGKEVQEAQKLKRPTSSLNTVMPLPDRIRKA
jgi:hypothetical protein